MIHALRAMARCVALAAIAVPSSPSLSRAAAADAVALVDLSADLPEDAAAIASSPGAAAVAAAAAGDPLIRAGIVLENGRVVARYVREDVDPDVPLHVWSCTKSWTGLLVGIMVDDGLLSVDDTLGEIFADGNGAWDDVEDPESLDFRKAVTIGEMLTMSSGLISPGGEDITLPGATLTPEINEQRLVDGGGSSLGDSLARPRIGTEGEFAYLNLSNILSYVVKERTGVTPRQYLAERVMPHLGIGEDEYEWLKNEDGVEFGHHGIMLTPIQMAKFGQLYQQGGEVGDGEGTRVVSKGWVDDSLGGQVATPIGPGYGYLFWNFGSFQCAYGLFGQDICVLPGTRRVVVQQRDPDYDDFLGGNLVLAFVASNSTLSFDAPSVGADDGVPPTENVDVTDPSLDADDSVSTKSRGSIGPIAQVAAWLLGASMLLSLVLC